MSNKLKCIVVDDEPLAIEVIESYIQQFDQLELSAKFENPVKAFEYLQSQPVDVLFIDIQMPRITGLEILRSMSKRPKVILTTAYRDYALDGFELEVTDYLLKPIAFDRFVKAIAKLKEVESIRSNEPDENADIFVKVDKKMVRLDLSSLLFLESQRDYLRIVCEHRELVTHMSISEADSLFPEEDFFRVHRSFVVSKKRIDSFSATEIEIGGHHIPIGRNYKAEVSKILDNLANN
ncbi:MAG: response regulator transcription factor [Cyclobacteriaceae bacterium]